MIVSRSANAKRQSAIARAIEALETRTLLSTSSVVLGAPMNLNASGAGLSPQFDWLAPLRTGSADSDLIVSNSGSSVSVLLSNGNGTFGTPTTYAVAGTPLPLLTGALISGSTTQDIVVGTTGSPGGISILVGNGDGTFQPAINHTALASNHALAVGNFISGGGDAIVTADNTASTSGNVAICFTDGAGHITAVDPVNIGHGGVSAIAVGAFTSSGNQDIAILSQSDSTVTILRGNGDGTFQAPVDFKTGASPTSLAVGDFNGDGKLDIVTADSTAGTVSFLAGNGNGTFAPKVDTAVAGSAVGGGPLKVRAGNFNSSGKADLLCLLSPGSSADATILLGQGNGTFQNVKPIATGGATRTGLAIGDVDGNGLPDVLLSDPSTVTTLLNQTNTDTTTPTAVVDANPVPGSEQSSIYQFTVTYTDFQQVDAQTLGDGNLIVTAPAGVTFPGNNTQEAATLVSKNLVSGPSIQATYQLTFGSNLTTAQQGAYSVAMTSGATAVTNAGGVPVNPGTFGTLNLTVSATNVPPPAATVNATQPAASSTANFYQFNVTYTDATAVNTQSLGDGNLTVTAPTGILFSNGFNTSQPTLVSQSLTNGPSVVATYQISFPANLTTADLGAYSVAANPNSVTNTQNVPLPAGTIGTFTPSFNPVVAPTGQFTPAAPKGKLKASVISGSKQGGVSVVVTNTSGTTLTGTVTVTLHAASSQIVSSSSVTLTSTAHKIKKLKSGKGFRVNFHPFVYPSTAGAYYLVADAALNGTADSYDGAIATPINVAAAFVDTKVNSFTPAKAVLTAGKKNAARLNVTNVGNVAFTNTSTVSIYASVTGVLDGTQTLIATSSLKLHLNPSQTKTVPVSFLPTTLPAAGSYHLIATLTVPGDTNSANDSIASIGTVTI